MAALDDLNAYDQFMLGAQNKDARRQAMEAEIEAALAKPSVEREDPTIGNEELYRGIPAFQRMTRPEGKISPRHGNCSLPLGGAMRGTRPGDPAEYVHETITSMPRRWT